MDWHLLGISFITVFLSELGDKSQLAAIALSGQGKSSRAVFFGTAGALLLTSLLGVLAGGAVSEFLPTRLLKAIACAGFAILAIRLLFFNDEAAETVE
jgi:putative Ca2+/H+ antiporter (TMEM165/GDT1 family)